MQTNQIGQISISHQSFSIASFGLHTSMLCIRHGVIQSPLTQITHLNDFVIAVDEVVVHLDSAILQDPLQHQPVAAQTAVLQVAVSGDHLEREKGVPVRGLVQSELHLLRTDGGVASV